MTSDSCEGLMDKSHEVLGICLTNKIQSVCVIMVITIIIDTRRKVILRSNNFGKQVFNNC